MMRPGRKTEKVFLYPYPVDFRKSINGLVALVELEIKVAVFDPVMFVFINRARNQVKVLYWERNGFCLWLKRLEAERFHICPDPHEESIQLTVDELNWMLDGFDLYRNKPHKIFTPRWVALRRAGIIRPMKSASPTLPNDPELLKRMLLQALQKGESDQQRIAQLEEQVATLRHRLFAPKSEQGTDADSPQLAMFNEAEEVLAEPAAAPEADEETVAPAKPRGKRKPLPAHLPRIDVVHELPEHELTCECGCRKQVIGEETSEQLDIVPAKFQVIRHIRKTYACKACETAPVTADKPAQLIEKSLASPSVLAMLLTTKYADGLPLYRFEKVLNRHGVEVSRQTLARWVIQCAKQFQPLLNLLRDRLLESPVIHCDETRLQVLHEPGRDPTAQSWMWVQAGGPPDTPIILFDYDPSRAQAVPLRLLEGYRGHVMTDDYAGYNAVAALPGITRLGCWAHARRKFVEAQKVQPKGKTGRADMALNLIGKLYGIERDCKSLSNEERLAAR